MEKLKCECLWFKDQIALGNWEDATNYANGHQLNDDTLEYLASLLYEKDKRKKAEIIIRQDICKIIDNRIVFKAVLLNCQYIDILNDLNDFDDEAELWILENTAYNHSRPRGYEYCEDIINYTKHSNGTLKDTSVASYINFYLQRKDGYLTENIRASILAKKRQEEIIDIIAGLDPTLLMLYFREYWDITTWSFEILLLQRDKTPVRQVEVAEKYANFANYIFAEDEGQPLSLWSMIYYVKKDLPSHLLAHLLLTKPAEMIFFYFNLIYKNDITPTGFLCFEDQKAFLAKPDCVKEIIMYNSLYGFDTEVLEETGREDLFETRTEERYFSLTKAEQKAKEEQEAEEARQAAIDAKIEQERKAKEEVERREREAVEAEERKNRLEAEAQKQAERDAKLAQDTQKMAQYDINSIRNSAVDEMHNSQTTGKNILGKILKWFFSWV